MKRLIGFWLLFVLQTLSYANVVDYFQQIKKDPNALYVFLKEMPKGGELHYHLTGGAYPEMMLDLAAKGHYCIHPETFVITKGDDRCTGIHPSSLFAQSDLYYKVIAAWSMKDFIPGLETNEAHFFNTFAKFSQLTIGNSAALLADVLERAASQNELYMEIMVVTNPIHMELLKGENIALQHFDALRKRLIKDKNFQDDVHKSMVLTDALLPETQKLLLCDKEPTKPACQLMVRFQYYILRKAPLDAFFYQALHAFEIASQSKMVVGVNVVQEEDAPSVLHDYHQQMLILGYLHSIYPKVHIALHAGELAPEVDPKDLRFHISDAVYTGKARRIGHGVAVAYEQEAASLLHYLAKQQIAVEINLTSNEKILKVGGKNHPLALYLANKVPVVLSTDDEGVLRTDLTREYVKAVIEHGVDYPTLKEISKAALKFSFLPGRSLWDQGKLVPSCTDLMSASCIDYVKNNEKAKVERLLALRFTAFEKKFETAAQTE